MRCTAGPIFRLPQVLWSPPPSAGPAQGSRPGALINYGSPRSGACYARPVSVKACSSQPVLCSGREQGRGGTRAAGKALLASARLSWSVTLMSLFLIPAPPPPLSLLPPPPLDFWIEPQRPQGAGLFETLCSSRVWAGLSPGRPWPQGSQWETHSIPWILPVLPPDFR